MKIRSIVGAGVLLALSWTQPALAQPSCRDLTFTGPVAREFPQARDACLGVETRDGRPYAHFEARIRSVRGNTVEAEFKMPDGTYTRPITFTPDPDARVRIAGQSYRYRDLARGQELDVWLPPDRWEIVVPEDPAQFAAARAAPRAAPGEGFGGVRRPIRGARGRRWRQGRRPRL